MSESGTDPALDFARAFEQAFGRVYLSFHRRDGKRSAMSPASRAVLTHLAHTGPLTIGELSDHLDRAQSVVSDIVAQLEGNGLLERQADPADRRRRLVWLTPAGIDRIDHERRVLSVELIARAAARLPAPQRDRLLADLDDLVSNRPNGES